MAMRFLAVWERHYIDAGAGRTGSLEPRGRAHAAAPTIRWLHARDRAFPEHADEVGADHRHTVEVPLNHVAAVLQQESALLARLDALRNHLEVEAVGKRDDGFCDRRIVRVGRKVAYEASIDLEQVD